MLNSAFDTASGEVLGHLSPGAMQPGLDGSDGPIDALGDFFIREILFVKKKEDQAILGSEPVDGLLELSGQVVRVVQSRAGIDSIEGKCRVDPGTASPQKQAGPAAVRGDLQQPGTDWPGRVEAEDGTQGAE